jgi:hypothetical protein
MGLFFLQALQVVLACAGDLPWIFATNKSGLKELYRMVC